MLKKAGALNGRRLSLRSYLLGLVVVSLVPALGIGAGTAYMMRRDLQQSLETRLRATAEAIAVAVDRQIETRRSVLDAISEGVAFDFLAEDQARDTEWFRRRLAMIHMAAVRMSGRIGVPVALFLPDESVAFRSNVPFGDPVMPLLAVADFRRAVAAKASVVGNLYNDPRLLIPVLAPVIRNDRVVAVLGASISFDFLSGVLDAVQPTGIAFMSIVDANGVIVAGSPQEPSTLVGRHVRPWQREAMRANPTGGMAQGTSLLGVAVVAAIQPLPAAPGWTVTVAAPKDSLGGLSGRPFFSLAVGGVLVFAASLALAVFLAQRLLRPVVALTRHAEALAAMPQAARPASFDDASAAPSPVVEFERLRVAITRANDVLRLLEREVNHRSKNLLAVVQAVVRMTKADTVPAFAAAVIKRIDALSRAHSLLASQGWEGAALSAVAARELEAYADRIHMRGPELLLASTAVQPVSMLLHELAVNATKYGALSVASGRIQFSWGIENAEQDLVMHWREFGGPAIAAPPERQGFGLRMIDATVRQMGGNVEYSWWTSGLECCCRIPVSRALRGNDTESDYRAGRS